MQSVSCVLFVCGCRGFMGGIRSAATLAGGNKVSPAPGPSDPEAPPPKDGACLGWHGLSGPVTLFADTNAVVELPTTFACSHMRLCLFPGRTGSAPAATPDDDMFDWVRAAEEVIARDNDEDDFVLFKLDTIDDKEPLYKQDQSCIMKLLDLVR